MIQFNLLPDVKIEYIKTQRRKRVIVFASVIASAATFGIFILLFLLVNVQQKVHLKNLDKDIDSKVSQIQQTPDLDKILTIQNQLDALPGLHDKKVFTSRMVTYLNQLTPAQATISDVEADFENNSIVIKGNADALGTVNRYADTLKFTDFTINGDLISGVAVDKKGRAFSNVVLKSFDVSLNDQTNQRIISYELTFNFNPSIFALVKNDTTNGESPVQLTIPAITSTRSETEKPKELFAPQPEQEGQRQ